MELRSGQNCLPLSLDVRHLAQSATSSGRRPPKTEAAAEGATVPAGARAETVGATGVPPCDPVVSPQTAQGAAVGAARERSAPVHRLSRRGQGKMDILAALMKPLKVREDYTQVGISIPKAHMRVLEQESNMMGLRRGQFFESPLPQRERRELGVGGMGRSAWMVETLNKWADIVAKRVIQP